MKPLAPSSSLATPLTPPLPTTRRQALCWSGLHGCSDSLAIASAIGASPGLFVVVTADAQSALRIEQEVKTFLGGDAALLPFPDWEILPYDVFSPLPEITSQRLRTFYELSRIQHGLLITPVSTLMHRVAPRTHTLANTFSIRTGSAVNIDQTRQTLESVGYQCVPQVYQHGEFAIRGSILDLYPMGSEAPYRIELFDDEVETIRTFDPESQRSIEKVEDIELFPAREFPFDEAAIKKFRQNFRVEFPDAVSRSVLYQDVSKGIAVGGIEYYIPLFVERMDTLFDYLPGDATLILHGDVEQAAAAYYAEAASRHDQRRHNLDRPPLPPARLFLEPDTLTSSLASFSRVMIPAADAAPATAVKFDCAPPPALHPETKTQPPYEPLQCFIGEFAGKILLVAESAGHRETLAANLTKYRIRPRIVESWADFLAVPDPLCLMVAALDHGLVISDPPLAIVTEAQLSGDKAQQRRRRQRTPSKDFGQFLRSLEELEIGAPVVHREHGVGRYLGLQRIDTGGVESEFLTIRYANDDKLYVPVSALGMVSRYAGADPEHAPLHRLGSEQWAKARRKALEQVRDVAAELLDIHARRAAASGRSFATLTEEYLSFAAQFPFEETPDQETAIQDVIRDLAAPRPMDRVVCGDVGFGKTEVAMRAAFIAAQNGRQVAVLVPTTLLAQQHYKNFCDRFADWPMRIDVLSRFVSKKDQAQTIADIGDGKVDIVIGTHRLLQKDIRFKDLGLVIIDEEHRFGVAHKEHFKKLRSEVDFLALTATPIPRTLDMALSGLREISVIATPPPHRHVIRTFVTEWDDTLVQEAITREIKRGGQVYFVHNKIETQPRLAERLEKLVPGIRTRIAHGQMPERELENIMLDFYHQRFNVLLCTTIVESGIDVPSANTILIDRADTFGLAQLHQLRGRVGRSHHRAYAYLLVPPKKAMTADAVKRLEAIEAAGELGAGFLLSSQDLEIRGAGELLGEEQSGQIQEIGFTLYTELLEKAVDALKSGKQPELETDHLAGTEVDLQCAALIPEEYLPDVHTRLVLYKRIANARSDDELRELQIEMIDRFGLLPEATKQLFAVSALKNEAAKLGIAKIEAGATGGRLIFEAHPAIDPAAIILLIQKEAATYKLDGPDKLRFIAKLPTPAERVRFVEALLDRLKA
ncbi:transcription-repair coupling factor [Methylococcus capsulatus]|uniref:Transcription-repair-coupling factor n=1 Tax=Methylococcus capsulatus TaxID=414 RepID=A0AA35UMH2_METCP|nr:transcription-repair coupling factor [Methylococcus capsulatus]CAI8865213.1 transcription-repair coupling factor [Methylococcus capsulatus]